MYLAPHTAHHGGTFVASLHSQPLDPSERFALFDSATPHAAKQSAELRASIGGYDDAFSPRPLLAGTTPVSTMPTDLGGPPGTPLPKVLSPRGDKTRNPEPRAAAPAARRGFYGLSPRPPEAARDLARDMRHADESPLAPDAPDDAPDDDPAPAPGPWPSEAEECRTAYAAYRDAATRNKIIRVIIAYLSYFPETRRVLFPHNCEARPGGPATPLDACRSLPVLALIPIAAAFAKQHYGLLMVMNTAAHHKQRHPLL